jgi:hypothetical protein
MSAAGAHARKTFVANGRRLFSVLKMAISQRLLRIPVLGRLFAGLSNRLFLRHFVPDLLALHDVLADTELAGRYWIWGGMLLGWAREGGLLAHDRDADFALFSVDLPRLLRAAPALRRAGFQPLHQFRNHKGQVTELTFSRHNAKFEFFAMEPVDGMLQYYVYGWPPDHLVEVEGQVPNQELVPFEFLGRSWLRHADHERELECIYGDWRTPQLDWDYLQDDRSAVNHRPWVNSDTSFPI